MDFGLTVTQEALLADIGDWCRSILPPGWAGTSGTLASDDWDFAARVNRGLAEKGWLVPGWPRQWGGAGWSAVDQFLLLEELGFHRLPPGLRTNGTTMFGPIVLRHGTDEQRARFLPGIAAARDVWTQGYSEPGAGSDLAGLATRADRDGDHFVINGTKIWSSDAHHANWCFMLARTDQDAPKHRGISLLAVPMGSPGITVRPLINMAGGHDFNQVFFEDVRVPVANLIGEQGRGWYVGVTLLDWERAFDAAWSLGLMRRLLVDLRPAVTQSCDPVARGRLAELEIRAMVLRLSGFRCAQVVDRGEPHTVLASTLKILYSELEQATTQFAIGVLGMRGIQLTGAARPPFGGLLPRWYMWASPATSYGGANEIERDIIARRGLGLPRA